MLNVWPSPGDVRGAGGPISLKFCFWLWLEPVNWSRPICEFFNNLDKFHLFFSLQWVVRLKGGGGVNDFIPYAFVELLIIVSIYFRRYSSTFVLATNFRFIVFFKCSDIAKTIYGVNID